MIFSNPARLNAVTLSMWRSLPNAVKQLDGDPGIRVLVLRGDGPKAFVSGADISEFGEKRDTADAVAEYERAAALAFVALQACLKPTVAMIHGYCIGGGLSLALACDLRFASSDAVFAIPAARLGLGYDLAGIRRVVQVVGPARAKDILFSARRLSADEALRWGLIERLLDSEALEPDVRAYAAQIAANAPLTIRAAKLTIGVAANHSGPDAIEIAEQATMACFSSEDYKEGYRAFREKRQPVFRDL